MLTDTTNLTHVTALVERNIDKRGYEKAWKEFLDEKRRIAQKQRESSSVPRRSSSRICNRNQVREVEGTESKPSTQIEAQLVQEPKSKLPTTVPLRRSNRLRNQTQIEAQSIKKCSSRFCDKMQKVKITKTPTIVPLRRSSRLRNQRKNVEATKPSDKLQYGAQKP